MATVIQHVKIFTGSEFIDRGYVKFEGDKIVEVAAGDYDNQDDPNTTILSFPGDTLAPGLIDSHIHALGGNIESIQQSHRFGVTTVCDMHNDPHDNAKLEKLASDPENYHKYADFKCAGLGAVVEGGWPIPVMLKEFDDVPNGHCIAEQLMSHWPKLKAIDEVEPYIQEQVEVNHASYIKMFHELGDSIGMNLPPPPMDIQRKVVETAHARGLIAIGHAFSHDGAIALLKAGVDGLTHIFFDKAPHDDFLHDMKRIGAHCSPTLALCASQTGQITETQNKFLQHPFAQKMLLARHEGKPVGFAMHCGANVDVEYAYKATRALYEAGIPLLVGTDAAGKEIGIPYGLGVHMEMHLMVHKVGMSVRDVLAAATGTIADRFKFDDRGKLEKGRLADFVLFGGDIEETLGQEHHLCMPIKTVWRHGVHAKVFREFGFIGP